MTEIRSALEELKGIAQELHNINRKARDLRERKKELEGTVIEYLETNDKKGVRYENIVFEASTKNASQKKPKSEILKDSVEVLKRYGVQDNYLEVIDELERSRKGFKSEVSTLKLKSAGLFN